MALIYLMILSVFNVFFAPLHLFSQFRRSTVSFRLSVKVYFTARPTDKELLVARGHRGPLGSVGHDRRVFFAMARGDVSVDKHVETIALVRGYLAEICHNSAKR